MRWDYEQKNREILEEKQKFKKESNDFREENQKLKKENQSLKEEILNLKMKDAKIDDIDDVPSPVEYEIKRESYTPKSPLPI